MIKRFFNSQAKTVTFAAGLLSMSALASRALGLLRDGLLAGYFGAGIETDIYFAAFRIPDFVYNFLIVGGISIAFLPLFSEYYSRNKKDAWLMASNILNVFLVSLIILCSVFFLLAPQLIKFVAPGFGGEERNLAVNLTRLLFLSPIIFGISNIFSGILHYFNRFLVYSTAPILYNFGIISGIIFLSPQFGILGVGMGVIIGAFLHLAIQIPSAFTCGFRYYFKINFDHPALVSIIRLMVPRSFAIGAQQINLVVITAIASTLGEGSIAVFNFANNLYYIPIGLFGISFALASFPYLSRLWVEQKKSKFLEKFYETAKQIVFLVTPLAVMIFLLRAQLVRIILGSIGPGRFGWQDTRLTAACLGVFSVSIVASAIVPFICRAYFSLKDTKTPTVIAVGSVVLNIFLSFLLTKILSGSNLFSDAVASFFDLEDIKDISVVGLALAFSLSMITQFILLTIFFSKKISGFKFKEIFSSVEKVVIGCVFLAGAVLAMLYLMANFVNMHTFLGVFIQAFVSAGAGGGVYLLVNYFLKTPELKIIKTAVLEQFIKKQSPLAKQD